MTLKVGDLVQYAETALVYEQGVRVPKSAIDTYGIGEVVAIERPRCVRVRWSQHTTTREPRGIARLEAVRNLDRVHLCNPHTDLPHLERRRPTATRRVIADALLERGAQVAARRVLSAVFYVVRWRGSWVQQAIDVCARKESAEVWVLWPEIDIREPTGLLRARGYKETGNGKFCCEGGKVRIFGLIWDRAAMDGRYPDLLLVFGPQHPAEEQARWRALRGGGEVQRLRAGRPRDSATLQLGESRMFVTGNAVGGKSTALMREIAEALGASHVRVAQTPSMMTEDAPFSYMSAGIDHGTPSGSVIGLTEIARHDDGTVRYEMRDSIEAFRQEIASLNEGMVEAARGFGEAIRDRVSPLFEQQFAALRRVVEEWEDGGSQAGTQYPQHTSVVLEGERLRALQTAIRESGKRARKTRPGPGRREWWSR